MDAGRVRLMLISSSLLPMAILLEDVLSLPKGSDQWSCLIAAAGRCGADPPCNRSCGA